ncbi:MAG: ABC transporter ATP-binding protein [Chloroflexi bacterium]|nr:ABC transporter ATP-binding protein [Chloroflexota bacterium]
MKQPATATPELATQLTSKLVVEKLTKRFQIGKDELTVFEQLNFRVEEGQFVCILGPSGCGKSTLLLCIAGLEPFDEGTILVDNRPVKGPGMDRGMVFQEYALFPWRTVLKNIEFGLEMKEVGSAAQRSEIAAHYLNLVGLADFANYYPHQLSGGMKQRVAIARSLVTEPEVLLMDEPFGALDAITRQSLQAETLRIWGKTRKTIVFVTHNLLESVVLADKVVCFTRRPGRIKQEVAIDLPRPRNVENADASTQRVMAVLRALLMEETEPQK